MIRRIRRLPSPALIVASIALVFAIAGGIGYAASKINGKRIRAESIGAGKLKDHTLTGRQMRSQSIPGGKLEPNTVTGTQVNESTLGKVPSAALADHATNADNATHANSADNANHATSADTASKANTADTANSAFSTFHDSGIHMPDSLGGVGNPIATLNIPQAGSYVINAKFEAFNASGTASTSDQCTLTAESDVDTMFFDVDGASVDDQEDVPMQLVHTFGSPGSVALRCSDGGVGDVEAFFTKITASQVANLTNTPF